MPQTTLEKYESQAAYLHSLRLSRTGTGAEHDAAATIRHLIRALRKACFSHWGAGMHVGDTEDIMEEYISATASPEEDPDVS